MCRSRSTRRLAGAISAISVAAALLVASAGASFANPEPVDAAPGASEPVAPIAVVDVVRPIPVAPSGRFARDKSAVSNGVGEKFKETADRMLKVARSLKGSRYQLGGNTPAGFDCSGYVGYILNELGLPALPRVSHDMYKAVPQIDRKEAEPGDLVFFHGKSGFVYHVGIYAGGNDMWHAPQRGKFVSLDPIYSSKVTFGRVINEG